MSSPISLGDAYAIARLAFKIGCAFTKGRKSAPAEFREVENQLHSLSAALQAFADLSAPGREPERCLRTSNQQQWADSVLTHVLESCAETLAHLEGVVKKYCTMVQPRDGSGPSPEPRYKKWKKGVLDNLSKIKWTTEGGDLARLRSNLIVHTNSMNLLLSVITVYEAHYSMLLHFCVLC